MGGPPDRDASPDSFVQRPCRCHRRTGCAVPTAALIGRTSASLGGRRAERVRGR